MRRGFYKIRMTRMRSFIALGVMMLLTMCGRNELFGPRPVGNANTLNIPFSVTYNAQAFGLENSQNNLELAPSTATNLSVQFTCTNTSTWGPYTVLSGATIPIPTGGTNCLVKLLSFQFNSTTYSATQAGATNFTTWLAGNVATFADTAFASTDTITVFVKNQVTQGGVVSTDTVSYNFTDLNVATPNSLPASSIQTGVPLTVNGQAAPNFTILAARYLSNNSNGSANLSFTLQCGANVTGSSGAYSCSGVPETQVDYIFIADAYSQGTIKVAQANAAFSANTPTAVVGGNEVGAGGSDLNANVVANGGFYTSNASPLSTGSVPIFPNNLNYVLMIRQKDANGNATAFITFYIDLPSTWKVAACGTYFEGGSGTSGDPYQVSDSTTLTNTASCSTSTTYFIQTVNIALSSWTPIQLFGQYNGNGYSITGLSYSSSSTTQNAGLFSTINSGAAVSNLTLPSVSVTGVFNTGALAGLSLGNVTNCSSSGTITANDSTVQVVAGGLIGKVQGGTISSSSSSATVTFNTGSASGTNTVALGGLVGFLISSSSAISVTSSYATGNVNTSSGTLASSMNFVSGGFIGLIQLTSFSISVSNSYATGSQTQSLSSPSTSTTISFGGFVGEMLNGGSISGCFSVGTITMTGTTTTKIFAGGILGYSTSSGSSATISNSYTMETLNISGTFTAGAGAAGCIVGVTFATQLTISTTIAACAAITATGVSSNKGFIGFENQVPTVNTSYYDTSGTGVPANTYTTGVTSYTTAQLEVQTNDTNLTFGTSSNNWAMPVVNPLASPTTNLGPVQFWQCGSNGIECQSASTCGTYFAGGAGTSSSPYQVNDANSLADTSNCATSSTYFIQTANIALSGSWSPIQLYGQYNGNGFQITGLSVTDATVGANIGLFSIINAGASVSNLTLPSISLTSVGNVGALAGTMSNGTVTNCSSSGTVTANSGAGTLNAGGLIGLVTGGTVSSSSSSVTLTFNPATASGTNIMSVGGLIGSVNTTAAVASVTGSFTTGAVNSTNATVGTTGSAGFSNLVGSATYTTYNITISNSYTTGSQTHLAKGSATNQVGGIVGVVSAGSGLVTISGCFANGAYTMTSDTSTDYVSGNIVGRLVFGTITNSYSMGSISVGGTVSAGVGAAGGFVGVSTSSTISNSYSADSSVSGTGVSFLQGFVGVNTSSTFTNVYLYKPNTNVPADSTTGITTYTTSTQMQTQGNFNFNFTNPIWTMPTANPLAPSSLLSPVLFWQCGSNGITGGSCP